ncbi:hypothetical protein MJ581_00555 [Escherichia coli]|nr:hypothetical protein MJ581_00555 [Escherichia coli]
MTEAEKEFRRSLKISKNVLRKASRCWWVPISIEKSELVSNELTKAGIKHNVLNAGTPTKRRLLLRQVSGCGDYRDQHGRSWYRYCARW